MIKEFNVGTKIFTYEDDLSLSPLEHYTVDERIKLYCAFLNLCGNQAEMEADGMILDYKHMFDTDTRYQNIKYFGLVPTKHNPQTGFDYKPDGDWGLVNKSLEDRVMFGALSSFTGINEDVVYYGMQNDIETMWQKYEAGDFKVIRSDLFQMFFSKGTNVRQWVLSELRHVVIPELTRRVAHYINNPVEHEEALMSAYSWMQENTSQKRLKFSMKDFWLDVMLSHPQAVNPESYIGPSTGSFKGSKLMFNEKLPTGKRTKEILIERFEYIKTFAEYPVQHNHYARNEAMQCYWGKYVNMKTGRLFRAKSKAPQTVL